jgi:hypothetical protein
MLALIACSSESKILAQGVDETEPGDDGVDADTGLRITDTGEDDPCFVGEPMVEIGTGEAVFEAIDDGDPIQIIQGAQDGHHILGSLRTLNTTGVVAINFDITPDYSGETISAQRYRLQLLPDPIRGDCAWIMTGLYAYLGQVNPAGAPFVGEDAVMRMELVDDDGREAADQVSVVPFLPLGPPT